MGEITPYAQILYDELNKRGIKAVLEFYDGNKSVDINIPEVNLDIEVDGSHHTEADQALTDLKRAAHSSKDGRVTYHIPNTAIFKYPSQCADAIETIVKNRIIEREELRLQVTSLNKEKEQLENKLKREKREKEKEKIEKKLRDVSKEYEQANKKLDKLKERISMGYHYSKIALTYLSKSLKYLCWASVLLSVGSIIFGFGKDMALFFIKLFAVFVLSRIVVYFVAEKLHSTIQKSWIYLDDLKKIIKYICGGLVVLSFTSWIFGISTFWALFFIKLLAILVLLVILINFDP
jgi:very-short-patch-repair endonuclease